MDLLTPQGVQREKQTVKADAAARVRDLAREEERLVASVNYLRGVEQEEIRKKEQREAEDQGALTVRKSVLLSEVEALESRRTAAMLPVQMRDAEFREREKKIADDNRSNMDYADVLREKSDAIKQGAERLAAGNKIHEEWKVELTKREETVKGSEEEVARATQQLSKERTEFALEKQAHEQEMDEREKAVIAATTANEIRAAALDEKENGFLERERGITVRYAFLEEAERIYKLNHPDHGESQ